MPNLRESVVQAYFINMYRVLLVAGVSTMDTERKVEGTCYA